MKKWICLLGIFLVLLIPKWGISRDDDMADETFSFEAKSNKPLEVILDMDAGEVIVEKGTETSSGKVESRYFKDDYRVKTRFDEEENRLQIRVDKDNWSDIKMNEDDKEEGRWAKIRILLPHGVEQLFDARIKAGEAKFDVGGLRFREFLLTAWAGKVEVCFHEPNAIVMEDLEISAKVGEVLLVRLGNARFKQANINGGIGEMNVDFAGKLENDCRAKVDLDIGEASIFLPKETGIRMRIGGGFGFLSQKHIDESFEERGRYYYTEGYDHSQNKMYLLVTPGLGELSIERE